MEEPTGKTVTGFLIGAVVAAAVVVAIVVVIRMDPNRREGPPLPAEYIYDLSELRKVAPELILYKPFWQFKTDFRQARAIAVGADGEIHLAGDDSIRILPPEAVGAAFDAGRARTVKVAGEPRCLAVDKDKTLYVGLGDHVAVYDGQGSLKAQWEKPGEKALLTSIALGGEDVFVADAAGRVVLRYDKAGKLIRRIGRKDPARNIVGFIVPSPHFDLAMAPDGLLRVANPGQLRIEAYTPGGDLELWWGRPSPKIEGFAGCCNPVSFAIDAQGRFVTCEKGLRRVKLYDVEGKFLGVVAGPEAFAKNPPPGGKVGELDVAVDAVGRVLVLDPYTGEVKVFAPKRKAP